MANQIPITYTVDINISIKDLSATVLNFQAGNFVGVSNVISPVERIRLYSGSTPVIADFGIDSEEATAAITWFSQSPNPGFMYISRWLNAASHGEYITNPTITGLGSLLSITAGEFTIGINGVNENITGLDFSAITTWADVAEVIEDGLQAVGSGGYTAATVQAVVTGLGTYFIVSSGTTGSSSSVAAITFYAGSGTDITTPLNLLAGTVVAGANIETPVQALAAISAVNDNYYGVTFSSVLRDTVNVVPVAQYIETLTKVFVTCSNDPNSLVSSATSDVLYQLKTLGLNRTMLVYHNQDAYYPDVSILSNMISVDFTGTNTVKDADFQPMPGIPAVPLTLNQLTNLVTKNGNTVISQAGLVYFNPGNMVSSRPFDITQNVDWLQVYMGTNVLNYLVNVSPKVPYTDGGVANVEQVVRQSLSQGVTNGMIASTNLDSSGNVIPPYTTSVPLVSTIPLGTRASRIGPPITFNTQLSGSIRKVIVNGTVTE